MPQKRSQSQTQGYILTQKCYVVQTLFNVWHLGGPIFLMGPTRDLQMKECPNPTKTHIFVGRTHNGQLQNNISIPTGIYVVLPVPMTEAARRIWKLLTGAYGTWYIRKRDSHTPGDGRASPRYQLWEYMWPEQRFGGMVKRFIKWLIFI